MEEQAKAVEEVHNYPAQVDLDQVQLSGWFRRAGAFIFDSLLILFASLILIIPLALIILSNTDLDKLNDDSLEVILSFLAIFIVWMVIYLIISSLYWGLFMKRAGEKNGQSLGQEIFKIRVLRLNGQSVGFWWAFLRQIIVMGLLLSIASSIISFAVSLALSKIMVNSDLVSDLSGLFYYLPYLLNYLWPIWDPINQAIHDKIVSSVVVRTDG